MATLVPQNIRLKYSEEIGKGLPMTQWNTGRYWKLERIIQGHTQFRDRHGQELTDETFFQSYW